MQAVLISREPGYSRTTTTDGRWLKAVERCKAAHLKAWQIDPYTYRVHSRRDDGPWYRVVLLPNYQVRCECPAGQALIPCAHAATVYLRLQRCGWPTEQIDTDADLFTGEDTPAPAAPTPYQRPTLESLYD